MRSALHLGVVASLLLAVAQAPLQHRHKSDPEHMHAGRLIHAHWMDRASADLLSQEEGHHGGDQDHHEHENDHSGANSRGDASDDRAWKAGNGASDVQMLDWHAGHVNGPVKLEINLPESPVRPILNAYFCVRPDLTPQNHDPPWPPIVNPRAPPA